MSVYWIAERECPILQQDLRASQSMLWPEWCHREHTTPQTREVEIIILPAQAASHRDELGLQQSGIVRWQMQSLGSL